MLQCLDNVTLNLEAILWKSLMLKHQSIQRVFSNLFPKVGTILTVYMQNH